MRIPTKLAAHTCGTLLLLGIAWGTAQAAGLLTPSDGSLPPLEIRDHQVEVLIQDGYAVTRVEQVFHNPNDRDLEAIYSFPVPEHGTVAEFTVWIDGSPVTGEVLEKARAEQVYKREKAAGRDAGLTVKDAYRTFDLRISPVRAGQDTRTRFVYMQPLTIDHGVGRYVYPLEEGGVDERKLSFWTANEQVTGRFDLAVKLRSAYPVEAVRVPHQGSATIHQIDARQWDVALSNGAPATAATEGEAPAMHQPGGIIGLDKDILVYWRLAQDLPGGVELVTYKPDAKGRGTFQLTLTPGDDLAPIEEGVDWSFVLDISGSMKGKYATLAEGVKQALSRLRLDDRFRIILFNDGAREFTNGYLKVTPRTVDLWADKVASVRPHGSTNLYAGLEMALDRLDADRPSGIALVTDGVANVGETRQRNFLRLLGQTDVRLFTFTMGNSANRPLLEALTLASNGFAVSVSNSDDIVGKIMSATSKLTHRALHGLDLKIDGVKTADLTPAKPGSLYRGQQLSLFGHYWGGGEARLVLNGRISGEDKRYETSFRFPEQSDLNPELERLWAYDRIRELSREIDNFGEDADLRKGIVDLGIEYGLVTDHTAMLVVGEEVLRELGIEPRNAKRAATERDARARRVLQPTRNRRVDRAQPMFSGNRATHSAGGGSGALSPIEVLLMLVLGSAVLVLRRRAS